MFNSLRRRRGVLLLIEAKIGLSKPLDIGYSILLRRAILSDCLFP